MKSNPGINHGVRFDTPEMAKPRSQRDLQSLHANISLHISVHAYVTQPYMHSGMHDSPGEGAVGKNWITRREHPPGRL